MLAAEVTTQGRTVLHVTGMLGIGDSLHQRAVLRELMIRHDVILQTYYSAMFHDLVAEGLTVRLKPHGTLRVKGSPMLESTLTNLGYGVEWKRTLSSR